MKQSRNNYKPFRDPALFSLIIANLFTIIFALINQWEIMTLLWIYWWQGIIIGLFNFIRILQIKTKTSGLMPTQSKYFTAIFFLFHYGIFHLTYAMFLFMFPIIRGAFTMPMTSRMGSVEAVSSSGGVTILLPILIFFVSHLVSFIYHKQERAKDDNPSKVMFLPYKRIIPMHLTIMLIPFIAMFQRLGSLFVGGGSLFMTTNLDPEINTVGQFLVNNLPLVFFLAVRGVVDITSHMKIHIPGGSSHLLNKMRHNMKTWH